MKEQIFVVEGKNDVTRLKQVFPNINVVSVNGSAVNLDITMLLKSRVETHEIVLCLDPDFPGEKIRKKLVDELREVSHVFIPRDKAYSKNKKKIGLEHLDDFTIKEAFKNIVKESEVFNSDVTMDFLYEMKLIGNINSRKIRENVTTKMNLGHANGKTLIERIKKFGVTKAEIKKALDIKE